MCAGGLTVYCFGDPAKMSDPNSKLSLRVHDEVRHELAESRDARGHAADARN